jgi:hypothetical protein
VVSHPFHSIREMDEAPSGSPAVSPCFPCGAWSGFTMMDGVRKTRGISVYVSPVPKSEGPGAPSVFGYGTGATRPPRPSSQRISFAAHASLGTSGVRFPRLRICFSKALLLLFKASTREGRTASVRPRLTDRLAAKDKTLPRSLDRDSAHPRTPGALVHYCRATLQATTGPVHFFFRRCFSVSVTLRQPKVTAQLPTGGDVSHPCPCVSMALFVGRTDAAGWSHRCSKPPRRTACGWFMLPRQAEAISR